MKQLHSFLNEDLHVFLSVEKSDKQFYFVNFSSAFLGATLHVTKDKQDVMKVYEVLRLPVERLCGFLEWALQAEQDNPVEIIFNRKDMTIECHQITSYDYIVSKMDYYTFYKQVVLFSDFIFELIEKQKSDIEDLMIEVILEQGGKK